MANMLATYSIVIYQPGQFFTGCGRTPGPTPKARFVGTVALIIAFTIGRDLASKEEETNEQDEEKSGFTTCYHCPPAGRLPILGNGET